MRPEVNSQCRLLFGGFFHPQGPSRNPCCWRRGLISRLGGPRHGNGHCRDGGWACFHLFGLGPGWQSRKTTSGYCQYTMLLTLGNSSKQQLSNWKTRLLAPCVCALPDDLVAPKAELWPIPRLARGSCPFSLPLRCPFLPGGSRLPWTRYCAGPQPFEPSLLRQWHWEEGGPAERCLAVAGSCGTTSCVPAEGAQLAWAKRNLFHYKVVEHLPALEASGQCKAAGRMGLHPRPEELI
jgi:hypothetical protein